VAGWEESRPATRWKIVKRGKLVVGKSEGRLMVLGWGLEYCPRAPEATVESFTTMVVILSLCQIQLGLIGGAEREGSQKEKERGIECAKETAGRHQIRECL